jgi:hypothetical protein
MSAATLALDFPTGRWRLHTMQLNGTKACLARCSLMVLIVAVTGTCVLARPIRILGIRRLIADSKLVFAGRVTSIERSGITTRMSYPTWENVVFEWLDTSVEVLQPIKGAEKGQVVHVMMLSVDKQKSGKLHGLPAYEQMYSAPMMLEPKKGEAFLLCLLPTRKTNCFASVTTPPDDNLGIFRLDRTDWQSTLHCRDTSNTNDPPIIWSLVDDRGRFLPDGAEALRDKYSKEIASPPTTRVIDLEWAIYTNANGSINTVLKSELEPLQKAK